MAITTVGDLLDYSRQQLNSEKLNNVDTYALWKDSELIEYINFAQQEFSRLTLCLPDYDNFVISIQTGLRSYDFDEKIIDIFGAWLNTSNQRLKVKTFNDIERGWVLNADTVKMMGGWEQEAGTPAFIIPDMEFGKIVLWPIPILDETVNLYVYKEADEVDAITDNLEIDAQYRMGLNFKIMSLAYGKHDVDETEDMQRSMLYAQKWQSFLQDAKATYDKRFKRITK
jgi:hypothetical protein